MEYLNESFEEFVNEMAMSPEEKKAKRKARRAAKKANGNPVKKPAKAKAKKGDTLEDKYNAIIKVLTKKKVPCEVQLRDDSVTVVCGWNYPDRIANKVWNAAEDVGLGSRELSVVGDISGGHVIKSQNVNGGEKRY